MIGDVKLPIIALAICFAQTVQAQPHINFWFRSTLGISTGKKTKLEVEFQHRRQNGFGNTYPLDKTLMFTFRTWFHYQHTTNVKFSVSPFAYFSNYKTIHTKADETVRPTPEIRFSGAVDVQHKLFNAFYATGRSAIEYRFFNTLKPNVIRLRNRLGCRYDVTPKFKIGIYDELLVNISQTGSAQFFDHNRVGLNAEYKIHPHIRVEMGYIYLTRLSATGTQWHENTLFLNVLYTLKE